MGFCFVASCVYWGERSEPRIGEVNANSVCLYVCHRPTGRIAHAQKLAKHVVLTRCAHPTNALHSPSITTCSIQEMSSFQENVYTLARIITSSLIHSLDKSYRVYKSIFFR